MLVPKLRFPLFCDQWDYQKLGNVIDLFSGIALKSEEISEDPSGIPILRGINITEGRIRHSKEIDRFFKGNINKIIKYYVKEHDLVLGMDGSKVGKNVALITKKDENSILIQRVSRIRSKSNSNIIFIYQHIFSKKFHDYVDIVNTSSGIPHISLQQIKDFQIGFPSLPEQQKIASFLSTVDEKINLLIKQLSLLEQYKKGVMQKIFSREIRFKDEDGKEFPDWEERKVSDIFRITRGNVLSVTKMELQEKNEYCYPVFSSQTKNGGVCGFYNEYLFENAITWTTDGANAGVVNYRKGKFYCTNVCGVLLSKEGYANECIAEILNSITKKYVSYVGNPKLMNNVIANISFLVPSNIYEQHKISSFLNSIDDKINKTKDQINKMELWKKGLLQQMFI